MDLHPNTVPNDQMGLIFENLIRRFNELANETAGDHFTPREVIRLMVNILFIQDDQLLATPGTVRKLLDPACGTGGMLAEAQNYLREHHSAARLYVYGQDYNKRAFATAASDMLMKQVDHNGGGDNVRFGDSFTDDQFAGETFDYLLANPPFGVDWKKQQKEIQREHDKLGFDGRFGAGLPRVNDGSLLFLQHMISKFEPVLPDQHKHGSRLAIVFSGSPLFTGGAGSGESDIRKWIIENDWLEAIIALPEQMFYNTGIGTYVWIVTNRKEKRRQGKIQLLDARAFYVPMRRSLGDKRRKIGEPEDGRDQIAEIVRLYGQFSDGDTSKVFDNADFGYTRVTVERPLRLRYQMTVEDKARFLDACPHLLDDVQAIDKALGREPQRDWNAVWARIEELLRTRKSRWKAPSRSSSAASSRRRTPKLSRWPGSAATRATSPTPTYATSRTSRSRMTSSPTSSARCSPMCSTPGWTAARTRWPTRSTSTATSTGTRRHVRWRDRRGVEAGGGRDHAAVAGGDGVIAIVIDPLPGGKNDCPSEVLHFSAHGLSQPRQGSPMAYHLSAPQILRGKLVNDGLVFVSEADLREPRAVRLMAGDIYFVS